MITRIRGAIAFATGLLLLLLTAGRVKVNLSGNPAAPDAAGSGAAGANAVYVPPARHAPWGPPNRKV